MKFIFFFKQERVPMNLAQKLSSKNIFVFNLVLIGAIFGFSLAFFSFSCSTPGANKTAQAEEGKIALSDSFSVAEGLQNAFHAISEKVLPSVVEINTVSITKQQTPRFNGIPWEFFFGPRGGDNQDGAPEEREYQSRSIGSGIIVRHDKDTYYILTNNHVVDGANEISITMNTGKEYPATLVGKDDRKDLAMISFKTADSWPVAELGDSDAVRVGDWAIAVGTPLGYMSSVTMGIVSALGRTGGPGNNINDFIQTDASINQGNSGGALVNIRGEVIGINTWIATNNSAGSVGLGFAIPINNTKRSIDEFITKGQISYGWLGVSLIDVDKDFLKALGVDGKQGAFAAQVFIGSPADKGGLRAGDFITSVNGKEVRGVNQLTLMVGELRPGDKAQFTFIRDGVSQNLTVTIEERTNTVVTDNKKLWPGVYALPLTDELRNAFKLDKNAQGLYVGEVINQTPASIVGLQRGDRIVAVNGKAVKDLVSFYKFLREETSKELWFSFIRGDSTLESPHFKR
jgi:Do/DeqQ family serine protease